jgi:hypothetical protein
MDLFADAEKLTRDHLAQLGVNHANTSNFEDLLHLALNLELKSVRPQPRTVFRSNEFSSKLAALPADLQTAAEGIIAKTNRGEDLAGHLSRASLDAGGSDGLLIDWALHHLHISTHKTRPSDPFFARTGPVMFVFFTAESAYFTDIHPHGRDTWTRLELLTIIHKNWPDVLEPHRLKGVTGTTRTISDPGLLAKLRAGGVNHPVTIDGKVYFAPGGGVTSAGTSLKIGEAADAIMIELSEREAQLNALTADQRTKIAEEAGMQASDLDFDLRATTSGEWRLCVKSTDVEILGYRDPFAI